MNKINLKEIKSSEFLNLFTDFMSQKNKELDVMVINTEGCGVYLNENLLTEIELIVAGEDVGRFIFKFKKEPPKEIIFGISKIYPKVEYSAFEDYKRLNISPCELVVEVKNDENMVYLPSLFRILTEFFDWK